ncbi:hypothetical protein KK062_27930 [Fulvivirgaceae bacterium PWU5]|uniref:Uncharacterized protein n=1 Tax=Dawidia cretensis TaxID=2782350 RepID=A0AAP2E2Z2_9BACT|nr:hypothetical protein [Dawidia cretensis]MBT1712103.1 hypothetical protein [Dawidia cretensis]
MKIWKEKPSKQEVEEFLTEYFKHLQHGELKNVQELTTHAYSDWLDTLYVVWQDHYLIHEIPTDSSFEGKEWLTKLDWLNDLTIKPEMEWLDDNTVWVDFIYKGEPSGYIGEFRLKHDENGYFMERVIFKMA